MEGDQSDERHQGSPHSPMWQTSTSASEAANVAPISPKTKKPVNNVPGKVDGEMLALRQIPRDIEDHANTEDEIPEWIVFMVVAPMMFFLIWILIVVAPVD